MSVVLAIARKEFADHLRNGWMLSLAAAFAVFALAISLVGFGFAGAVGPAEQETTVVSLTSLAIYLVPLLGLVLGYDGICGERERGTWDLLLAYPLSAVQVLAGKWLGLCAVLAVTLALGLAAPAALALAGGGGPGAWLVLLATAAGLGAVFVALALLLSAMARERGRILGLALGLWLLLVVLYDLGLIGLLVATGGDLPVGLVQGLLLLNPTSLFRLLTLQAVLAPAALAQLGLEAATTPLPALAAALALWAVAPLVLAAWRLRRLD